MIPFLLRRLGHGLFVMALVSVTTFAIMMAAPGGPAILADPKLSTTERAAIEARLGLDQPATVQFARWAGRAARGDLGASFLYQTPTLSTIASRVPHTLVLTGTALVLTIALAIPLGMLAAERQGSLVDRCLGFVSGVALAVPAFWLGLMLILIFAVWARVLPAGGAGSDAGAPGLANQVRHLVLPALVLAAAGGAELLLYTRTAARGTLAQPFMRNARARGLSRERIVWRHGLRHTLLSVVSVIGLQFPRLMGRAAITETVFSWPGLGRLGVEAALGRDYPLVMAVTLVVSAGVVIASVVADAAQLLLDPRVRVQ